MFIKFLDTQEVVEVTSAHQLANTRFVPQSIEEVEAIHQLGFYPFEDLASPGDAVFLWDRDFEYTIAPNNEPLDEWDECGTWPEFELVSPIEETPTDQDLSNQVRTVEGVERFVQEFDAANTGDVPAAYFISEETEPGTSLESLIERLTSNGYRTDFMAKCIVTWFDNNNLLKL